MEGARSCACQGKNLDRFLQPVILHILSGGPDTGYAIVQRTKDYVTFAEDGPDPTGVYRYLRTLKERGMIAQEAPDEARSHSAARYFLTHEGRDCLDRWRETLSIYADQIHDLTSQLGQ